MASPTTLESMQAGFTSHIANKHVSGHLSPMKMNNVLELTHEQRNTLLRDRVRGDVVVPALRFDTVEYRRGPSHISRESFRTSMLNHFRRRWKAPDTEVKFLELVDLIANEGCAMFSGLVNTSNFEKLISDYEKAQQRFGNQGFLHSYVNLAQDPQFLRNEKYNDTFAHPLLVALIAYQMGGALRIVDMRGKDTDPISVNAQDNMLHIDNTPFRDEYKVLVSWRRGEAKGPSGQNFAFLPGTHKGNRDVLVDQSGAPWSTERDSLFVTPEAIDGLFAFQAQAIGHSPMVVEAEYPEHPLSILFPAGSLVHHRYRTEHGDPRSCMIAAFHVASENPGALVREPPDDDPPKTLIDFMIRQQSPGSNATFLSLLSNMAEHVESTITNIFTTSSTANLIDISQLALSEERLQVWRETVISAPSASSIKFSRNVYISDTLKTGDNRLIENLATAMMYDKHGLLQLILYEDSREEIRKLARKRIGEMSKDKIARRLENWLPTLAEQPYTASDIPDPAVLRELAGNISVAAAVKLQAIETLSDAGRPDLVLLRSLVRLISDLGESVERCERPESCASTSLFLFWAADDIVSFLDGSARQQTLSAAGVFLRNYVGLVLLMEAERNDAIAQV